MSLRTLSTFRPPKRTPHSLAEGGRAIIDAFRARGVAFPSDRALLHAAAKGLTQIATETGSFDSCYWDNVGNLRVPGANYAGFPFFLNPGKVDENIDGEHVVASGAEDPLRIFRAFGALAEGVGAWLDLIHDAYPLAYASLLHGAGGPRQWGEDLGQPNARGRRYYTADPERYGSALEERYPVCFAAVSGKSLLPSLRFGAGMGAQEALRPLVAEWQKALTKARFPCGNLDGRYGRGTVTATAAWQEAQGIRKDGWCGPFSRFRMGLPFTAEGAA